jgi:hypothetical protein
MLAVAPVPGRDAHAKPAARQVTITPGRAALAGEAQAGVGPGRPTSQPGDDDGTNDTAKLLADLSRWGLPNPAIHADNCANGAGHLMVAIPGTARIVQLRVPARGHRSAGGFAGGALAERTCPRGCPARCGAGGGPSMTGGPDAGS